MLVNDKIIDSIIIFCIKNPHVASIITWIISSIIISESIIAIANFDCSCKNTTVYFFTTLILGLTTLIITMSTRFGKKLFYDYNYDSYKRKLQDELKSKK